MITQKPQSQALPLNYPMLIGCIKTITEQNIIALKQLLDCRPTQEMEVETLIKIWI